MVLIFYATVVPSHLSEPRRPESDEFWPSGYAPVELPDCSNSASISDSVVPSALASLSAWTMEGVLSARSTAPCARRDQDLPVCSSGARFARSTPGGITSPIPLHTRNVAFLS